MAFLWVTIASTAYPAPKQDLATELVQFGTHNSKDERHTVSVDGCQLTTFRSKQIEDGTWELWSSFQFDMRSTDLVLVDELPYVAVESLTEEIEELGLLNFKTRPETWARFERSNRRGLKEDYEVSPRNGGASHHYTKISSFMVVFLGQGSANKVKGFAHTYLQYVENHCRLFS